MALKSLPEKPVEGGSTYVEQREGFKGVMVTSVQRIAGECFLFCTKHFAEMYSTPPFHVFWGGGVAYHRDMKSGGRQVVQGGCVVMSRVTLSCGNQGKQVKRGAWLVISR